MKIHANTDGSYSAQSDNGRLIVEADTATQAIIDFIVEAVDERVESSTRI